MQQNVELLKELKRIGWAKKNQWDEENPGVKFISPHKILNTLQEPKDWAAVAEKCANNPKHELYGHTGPEIQAIWKSRGSSGQNRGVKLDDYITAKLVGAYFNLDLIEDEKLRKKCLHFDDLNRNVLSRLEAYIGSEIWLNSTKLGVLCRLDSAFSFHTNDIFVSEWKNTEKMSIENRFQKLLGPAALLDDSDLNKYTIQSHFYRYILEEYREEYPNLIKDVHTRVFQFSTDKYTIHKEPFTYDPKFIEEIVKYSKSQL